MAVGAKSHNLHARQRLTVAAAVSFGRHLELFYSLKGVRNFRTFRESRTHDSDLIRQRTQSGGHLGSLGLLCARAPPSGDDDDDRRAATVSSMADCDRRSEFSSACYLAIRRHRQGHEHVSLASQPHANYCAGTTQ